MASIPTSCPEASVRNYHSALCDIPKEGKCWIDSASDNLWCICLVTFSIFVFFQVSTDHLTTSVSIAEKWQSFSGYNRETSRFSISIVTTKVGVPQLLSVVTSLELTLSCKDESLKLSSNISPCITSEVLLSFSRWCTTKSYPNLVE
jgi:hypothetical protein